ncbi:MAG: DUF255 domain-containing protein [Thiotrichaceae bacterium]
MSISQSNYFVNDRLPKLLLKICIVVFSITVSNQSMAESSANKNTDNTKSATPIKWQNFDAKSFNQAKKENKYILLDLVAVWCHWCHVMEEKTYQDANVQRLIKSHFIPVQADHDLRPDLAERYREWGWPATIIITPDGTEIVKRAGYINPENMASLLQAVVDDPSPESSTLSLPKQLSSSPILSKALTKTLKRNHIDAYDNALGGLKINQKFLDADSVEWDLLLAKQGDQKAKQRVQQTLKAAAKLIDPAFGGAYQYSTHADWKHPHYEKIMLTQHKYLRVYSQACTQLNQPEYCQVAKKIANYLLEFLYSTKQGAFYTSQDADLSQGKKSHAYFALNKQARLAQGLPRVDKHHYAAHNGRAIEGLAMLYQATGDKRYLDYAIRASRWILKNRRYYGGGFRHYQLDAAGPYLADTLYMGKAFLTLYEVTKNQEFLTYAMQAATFIGNQFKNPKGGLVSAVDNGTPTQPLPQLDQNIDAARFLIKLHQYSRQTSQQAGHSALAGHVMKLLATEKIATSRLTEAGILLAMSEYNDL